MALLRSGFRRLRAATVRPFLKQPRFVILGTGRSGSGYIAGLLTAAGVPTGHEAWWNPQRSRIGSLAGDSSWCATFALQGYDGKVFHQIRNPLAAISSIAATDMAPHSVGNPWYEYRRRYVELCGDPVTDAVAVVATWLERAERVASWTWRLEDLTLELVAEIVARVGYDPTQVASSNIDLASVSRNTKDHEKRDRYQLQWDDLQPSAFLDSIQTVAEKYGYL